MQSLIMFGGDGKAASWQTVAGNDTVQRDITRTTIPMYSRLWVAAVEINTVANAGSHGKHAQQAEVP